jgi:hypothetical protein
VGRDALYKQTDVWRILGSGKHLKTGENFLKVVSEKLKRLAPPKRLFRAAKISDYRLKRVVAQFARDASATEAARATGLSVNAAHDLYRKLRVFFFEVGLFLDYYAGHDPETFESEDPALEKAILDFHFERVAARRGLKSPATEPPYHFAESCWRYDFKVLMDERPSDAVRAMMLAHLLELIRLCGPVGAPPRNRAAGALAVARQIDQRILWLERNAPGFSDKATRQALREARSIDPENI